MGLFEQTGLNGILLVDKPQYYTTHDVVDVFRRCAGMRRVGHAGTLDPMATGLVILLVGEATQLFDKFSGCDKSYQGILTLGMTTDTQDLDGRITTECDATHLDEDRVCAVFSDFVGTRQQKVSRHSAVKIGGRKCYEMARKNIAFETPTRTVTIKSLRVCAYASPDVFFTTEVSKGTYIRALCEDIGASLGVGAVLTALRRTQSGCFRVEDSVSLAAIESASRQDIANRLILPTPDS